jgi:hypothetical protein
LFLVITLKPKGQTNLALEIKIETKERIRPSYKTKKSATVIGVALVNK